MARRKIGRTRRLLAENLQRVLREAGLDCDVEPEDLLPAEGYWKQSRADVCKWEGIFTVRINGKTRRCQVWSWDTMTECCRNPVIHPDAEVSGYLGIEILGAEPAWVAC